MKPLEQVDFAVDILLPNGSQSGRSIFCRNPSAGPTDDCGARSVDTRHQAPRHSG